MCVPSYKRPDIIKTNKIYKNIKVYICETEQEEYKKNYPDINFEIMKKGIQGNVARVRNYILDNEFKKNDRCVIIDDDFSGVYKWEKNEKILLDEKELKEFLENGFSIADELNVKLWGININSDKMSYREYSPISFLSPVLGPISCHLKNEIRYDERIPLKEDYDFFIQQIYKNRKILRFNKYFYVCKQSNLKGGCSMMRNLIEEERQFRLLEKKWGKRIIKRDIKKNDYNPIIKVPIKGI